MAEQTEDLNELEAQRRAKLAELREQGQAYPNTFRPQTTNDRIVAQFGDDDADALAARAPVKIAGRMMTRRVMGKASFAHLQDVGGRMQVYFRADSLPDGVYDEFKKWDIGDIVGVEGTLFRTKTGELSVRASSAELVVKGLRPLPEKWHGLSDQETRYRQRYVDLIVTDKSRDVFRTRSRIIEYIRQYFLSHDFLEVETPMMQVIPGGAVARPFETHHNALDMKLYLRIAPELYLKRLLVGGFERVFEINRNFRNEGVSVRHNPEFTMLEYYQAYADVFDAMDHTEQLFRGIAEEVVGSHAIQYQGEGIDFGPAFERLRLKDSLLKFNPQLSEADLDDDKRVADFARSIGVAVEPHYGRGKIWFEIFEKTVEANLRDPTFITHYPTEVSPLSRANDDDSFVTDRFEFFVGGRELANGFSELNDPEDQAERFRAQVASRDAGDDEAMYFDADYIRALEVGMPPAAGEGIGIDRLVMLFTDSASIRDVLLFPHMRPEF